MLKFNYKGFTCQVLHGGTMTEPIKVKTHLKQGCLFVVLDWVSKNAYEGKHIYEGLQCTLTQRLKDLNYADDLCLRTHQLADMKVKGKKITGDWWSIRTQNQHPENKRDANWREATRIIGTTWGSC